MQLNRCLPPYRSIKTKIARAAGHKTRDPCKTLLVFLKKRRSDDDDDNEKIVPGSIAVLASRLSNLELPTIRSS